MARGTPCPNDFCEGTIGPDGACALCGSTPHDQSDEELDRIPCPDGNCIGVIGDDGRCSECGQSGSDDLSGEGWIDDEKEWDDADEKEEWTDDDQESAINDDDDDDDDRTPCPDGSCIGIIGPDGRCIECDLRLDED